MAKTATKKAPKKGETKSVISADKAAKYKVSDVKTASGKRKSVDNDDKIAKALRGKSVDDLRKIANKTGLGDRFKANWSKLNPGMLRMSMGNALRAKARHGELKASAL